MSVLRRTLTLTLLSLCATAAKADDLKVSGSVRLRYEAIDGQARTGFDSKDALVNLRTQVMADYGSGPIHLVAEIFDSRAWGADPGTPLSTGEVNTLEPVQAYLAADLGPLFGKGTKVSIHFPAAKLAACPHPPPPNIPGQQPGQTSPAKIPHNQLSPLPSPAFTFF